MLSIDPPIKANTIFYLFSDFFQALIKIFEMLFINLNERFAIIIEMTFEQLVSETKIKVFTFNMGLLNAVFCMLGVTILEHALRVTAK